MFNIAAGSSPVTHLVVVTAAIQRLANLVTEIRTEMKDVNVPAWIKANAWREIFARIFENTEIKTNVSPEWLINPATNRRLKLDMLYPELGVAIRFEGLEGKQRRQRPSLEEEEQQRVREQARVAMCRAHGIHLILVDVTSDNPGEVFQEVDMMLSRAGQRARKEPGPAKKIAEARAAAVGLARRITSTAQLKLYADLWEDRQYQPLPAAEPDRPAGKNVAFTEGMAVEHTTFGPGVVLAVTRGDDDTFLTVDFITAGQKTLAASLVVDKLHPRSNN